MPVMSEIPTHNMNHPSSEEYINQPIKDAKSEVAVNSFIDMVEISTHNINRPDSEEYMNIPINKTKSAVAVNSLIFFLKNLGTDGYITILNFISDPKSIFECCETLSCNVQNLRYHIQHFMFTYAEDLLKYLSRQVQAMFGLLPSAYQRFELISLSKTYTYNGLKLSTDLSISSNRDECECGHCSSRNNRIDFNNELFKQDDTSAQKLLSSKVSLLDQHEIIRKSTCQWYHLWKDIAVSIKFVFLSDYAARISKGNVRDKSCLQQDDAFKRLVDEKASLVFVCYASNIPLSGPGIAICEKGSIRCHVYFQPADCSPDNIKTLEKNVLQKMKNDTNILINDVKHTVKDYVIDLTQHVKKNVNGKCFMQSEDENEWVLFYWDSRNEQLSGPATLKCDKGCTRIRNRFIDHVQQPVCFDDKIKTLEKNILQTLKNHKNILIDDVKHSVKDYVIDLTLHVITASVFEEALRELQIENQNLVYILYHPPTCSYVVAIPTFEGSYMHNAARKDNRAIIRRSEVAII